MRAWLLAVGLLSLAQVARAGDVTASAPTALAVTIYRAPSRNGGSIDLENLGGFALVTESLGGYVAFDALTSDASGDLGASDNPLIHDLAPLSATVLCRSVQAHLLANQIDLLSISDISVADAAADNSLGTTGLAETCAKITARLARPNGGVGAARPVWTGLRIVAYHDPNDQLTFYNRHGPNFEVTNVVAPFANTWIPFLVVDPLGAHVGQETDKRILDMVAFGSDGVTVGKSEAR